MLPVLGRKRIDVRWLCCVFRRYLKTFASVAATRRTTKKTIVKEWLQGDNMFTKPKPPEIKAEEEMDGAIRSLPDIIKSIDLYTISIEEYSKRSQLMSQLYNQIFQNKANHHVE